MTEMELGYKPIVAQGACNWHYGVMNELPAGHMTIQHLGDDLQDFASLQAIKDAAGPDWREIKNIRRTYVAEFSLRGQDYMFKIPRARDLRPWERMLTLFRAPDVERFSQSMDQLLALGIPGPRPVMLGLHRRFGMVTHSFIIYRKLEGHAAKDESEIEQVCRALDALHEQGYLRRDALLRNFVITPDGQVGLIDFRLSRPGVLAQAKKGLECDKLISSAPTAIEYLDMSYRERLGYRFLKGLQQADMALKTVKRALRGR